MHPRPTISSFALAMILCLGAATPGARAEPATAAHQQSDASSLAAALLDRSEQFKPDDAPGAEATLRAAMAAEPKNATWPLALGVLKMRDDQPADAEPYLEKATELDPKNADALYWHATALFSTINDASLFAKGRMASKARENLERAVEIDPAFIDARIALVEFYRNAPGIAGGSTKKAKQHAEALLRYEGGAIHGHRLLAQIAMEYDDWDEASRHVLLAAEAASTDETRAQILMVHAYGLLTEKEDPAAALPIAQDAYDTVGAETEDFSIVYVYGRALAETGDCAAAIPLLQRVLVLNEGAQTTRYILAECLNKQGRTGEAIAMYEEFLDRFPKADQAKDAKQALKDLQRQ